MFKFWRILKPNTHLVIPFNTKLKHSPYIWTWSWNNRGNLRIECERLIFFFEVKALLCSNQCGFSHGCFYFTYLVIRQKKSHFVQNLDDLFLPVIECNPIANGNVLQLIYFDLWQYWSNIFTAKIFRIILNGKKLLYSGLSWKL